MGTAKLVPVWESLRAGKAHKNTLYGMMCTTSVIANLEFGEKTSCRKKCSLHPPLNSWGIKINPPHCLYVRPDYAITPESCQYVLALYYCRARMIVFKNGFDANFSYRPNKMGQSYTYAALAGHAA